MGVEHDEAGWIRQSRDGDLEAFGALVERYQRMVHALTFRMTGSMADAEDLAQEAFLQAFRRLDTFRSEAKFSSWLCQIAINTCLNWSKREKRRDEVQRIWAENEAILGEDKGERTEAEAPITRRVTVGLMRLPAKQRAAVVLTVYEGLNHAQAAQVLGCSETTVSWRLFAARAKLKRWLKP